jgi:hypothetical protein
VSRGARGRRYAGSTGRALRSGSGTVIPCCPPLPSLPNLPSFTPGPDLPPGTCSSSRPATSRAPSTLPSSTAPTSSCTSVGGGGGGGEGCSALLIFPHHPAPLLSLRCCYRCSLLLQGPPLRGPATAFWGPCSQNYRAPASSSRPDSSGRAAAAAAVGAVGGWDTPSSRSMKPSLPRRPCSPSSSPTTLRSLLPPLRWPLLVLLPVPRPSPPCPLLPHVTSCQRLAAPSCCIVTPASPAPALASAVEPRAHRSASPSLGERRPPPALHPCAEEEEGVGACCPQGEPLLPLLLVPLLLRPRWWLRPLRCCVRRLHQTGSAAARCGSCHYRCVPMGTLQVRASGYTTGACRWVHCRCVPGWVECLLQPSAAHASLPSPFPQAHARFVRSPRAVPAEAFCDAMCAAITVELGARAALQVDALKPAAPGGAAAGGGPRARASSDAAGDL